jgi:ABC-2 type transport system ATP-binding protein
MDGAQLPMVRHIAHVARMRHLLGHPPASHDRTPHHPEFPLSIALALINDPEVVFLDELTTGLDPQARRAIWELVRDIRERGKTVFLTTHLMEEAEGLCDRVAIIEHGRIIDIGRPTHLVDRHCPERSIVLVTEDAGAAERFARIPHVESVTCHDTRYTLRGTGEEFVSDVIECLSENHIHVTDFRTILPSLEDVFLKLTATPFATSRS